jgi:Putative peptidoglycan binding domain
MRPSNLTRFCRNHGACAVLVIALPLMAGADTTTSTTTSAKKPATTHSTTAHSTSSHSTSSHAKSSHATSGTTKTHSTSATSSHAASAGAKKHSSSSKSSHGKKSSKSAKKRGQQVIDSDRAREIQEALIREHYLTGEPTGTWDSTTQAAMQRYQADQGWQNKTTPDSRALIKLGLGPSNDHLLNPESAMTSGGPATSGEKGASKTTPNKTTSGPVVPPSGADPNPVPKPVSDSTSTPVPNAPAPNQQPNR